MPKLPRPNSGKKLVVKIDGKKYARYPIRTCTIMPGDDLAAVIKKYVGRFFRTGDLLIISESVVAISQRRAYKFDEIRPSRLATFLARFVTKVPYGIGLGRPQTMHLAIQEVGVTRILLATAVAALTRPLGFRGMFYRVAGRKAALIDGPCSYTLPPFNKYATLGPENPVRVCGELSRELGVDTAIVDANDIGTVCIGWSERKLKKLAEQLTRDNPMGQASQRTPILLTREVN